MIIHLVGGFLGSGKTTAIAAACNLLKKKGIKTAVIMNDQGSQLVDSRFISAITAFGQVEGGCFCCNYRDLDDQIAALARDIRPDVIFAESVGSCTDLVATVLKPMMAFGRHGLARIRYSTFADATLLLRFLADGQLPFLPETNYIWQKQIEEAAALVVSKCDLLNSAELLRLKKQVQKKLAGKMPVYINSFDQASPDLWLEIPEHGEGILPEKLEVDYDVYAKGEENLAWLDVDLDLFTADGSAAAKASELMNRFEADIRAAELPIGHLKYYLICGARSVNWSATLYPAGVFILPDGFRNCRNCALLVNARVQASPDALREMFYRLTEEMHLTGKVIINIKHSAHFAPGYPMPTHRL